LTRAPPKATWLEFENEPGAEFEFFLTEKLGFGTVERMRREMPQREFLRWSIYYSRAAQKRELASMRRR
jgi:hypothetical protein